MKLYKAKVIRPTEVLEKGRKGLPDGTIRDYNGMKYKKVGGKWEYLGKQESTKGERKKGSSPDKVSDGASSVDIEPRVGLKTPVGEIVAEKNGMWAIRPNDGKIGGSLQLMSTQDLKEEIFLAERRDASATRQIKQQESDRKSKEDRDDTKGFLDSMSSMDRGRAKKHLFDRSTVLDGKVYRNKEFVEELANRELTFDMKEIAYGDSGKKKMRYIARTDDGTKFYDLSQTQYKYGKHLSSSTSSVDSKELSEFDAHWVSTMKEGLKEEVEEKTASLKDKLALVTNTLQTTPEDNPARKQISEEYQRLTQEIDKQYERLDEPIKKPSEFMTPDQLKDYIADWRKKSDTDSTEKSTTHKLSFGETDMETRKVYSATELKKAQQG